MITFVITLHSLRMILGALFITHSFALLPVLVQPRGQRRVTATTFQARGYRDGL